MIADDKQELYARARGLLARQNFVAAVVAGIIATLLASVAFGLVAARWSFAYGFAAAGAGVFIGSSIGFLGRGIESKFAVLAAICTVAACVLGNVCLEAFLSLPARAQSLVEALGEVSFSSAFQQGISKIGFVDLVFWFVAIFAAVFLARRPLSRAQRLAIGALALEDQE